MTARALLLAAALIALSPDLASAKPPDRLEYLDIGPLKLKDLAPGKISYLKQVRIIDGKVHRRFAISAGAGRFEYRGADGKTTVLGGRVHAVHLEGYIYFAQGDQIGSMIVEKKDDLTFILTPEEYSLPTYGGGSITLDQKRVWVGNASQVDVLAGTGQVYFATDAVTWKGIRLETDAPALSLLADARNSSAKQGVTFVFDLATARLGLSEGVFQTTELRPDDSVPAGSSMVSFASLRGALQLAVHERSLAVTAAKLSAELVAAETAGPEPSPVVAAGTLSLSSLTSLAKWDATRISLSALSGESVRFTPSADVRSLEDSWARPRLSELLKLLKLPAPEEVRKIAFRETEDRLKCLGPNLAFASLRRTRLETVVRKELTRLRLRPTRHEGGPGRAVTS